MVLLELQESGETRLFACGSNSQGQLGLANSDGTVCELTEVLEAPRNIRSISCGARHTLLLTEDDRLYGTGDNTQGQLGYATSVLCHRKFTKLLGLPSNITQIACGSEHTVLLCRQAPFLWVTGQNTVGQLGMDYELYEHVDRFTVLPDVTEESVVAVACGNRHTIVQTATGQLFGCGENSKGQLGLGIYRRCARKLTPLSLLGED
jgi:alpha-tubulin suppressor-like RCC1 family protein